MVNSASSRGFLTGSNRSRSSSNRLKIAVFAPIPRASESTATAVNIGLLRSERKANFRLENSRNIARYTAAPGDGFSVPQRRRNVEELKWFRIKIDLRAVSSAG